jgi:propanediol dehydratase small subunit
MTTQNRLTLYPVGEKQPERIQSRTGIPFQDVTLEAVRAGRVGSDDLTIHADTLRMQAEAAAAGGYRQLATNLRRAAELVNVPNKRLLEIYEALRPRRSTYAQLLALGDELETQYGAVENAGFVRQAAEAYRDQGLLRAER